MATFSQRGFLLGLLCAALGVPMVVFLLGAWPSPGPALLPVPAEKDVASAASRVSADAVAVGAGMIGLREILEGHLNCSGLHSSGEVQCVRKGVRVYPRPRQTLAQFWEAPHHEVFEEADVLTSVAFQAVADVKCMCHSCRLANVTNRSVIYVDPKCLPAAVPKLLLLPLPFFVVTHQRDESICWQCFRGTWDHDISRPNGQRERLCCALLSSPLLLRWYAINTRSTHPKLFAI
eukprot:RCo030111